ncbi:MAG: hypothetical protein M5U01_13835 [Ardenticatenaceae bacterium]|nr:hypothetical protein [Ardenticatenaceae bacterium]
MLRNLDLPRIDAGRVLVYYSPGREARARRLLTLVQDAQQYLTQLLRVDVRVILAVLDRDDWRRSRRAPYGYPHSNPASRTVFAPAEYPARLYARSRKIFETAPPELRARLIANGETLFRQVATFFDLVLVHEVAHLFIHERRLELGTQWLLEFSANYLTYCYLSDCQPGIRYRWDVWAEMQAALPDITYRSLEEFEANRGRIDFANFSWYQGQFNLKARQLYEQQGVAFVTRLVEAFALTPDVVLARVDRLAPSFVGWAEALAGGE